MKKSHLLIVLFVIIPMLFSCESDEAKFQRIKLEKENNEKADEKLFPSNYLVLDNDVSLEEKTVLFAFDHYSYKGKIISSAKYTSYRDVVVCFEFRDKEKNVLDEFCYEIPEVINIGESQNFQLNIEEPKNRKDISSFHAEIRSAEVLTK